MNESGMPAMPPAPPPSYLRPPTGSPLFLSGKPSGFKVELLIAAFIFALIAAGVWFYVLRKPATPTVTLGAAPTGTLLFFSASPKPDLYQYSFDKSSITPVLPPLESNLVAAVISPARDQVLFVESSSTSKVLLRTSLTTGKSTTIASVKDTPSTLSPAWSYDEKQVAYFIPAPPNTQGGGKIGVVSLAKNTTVKLGVPGSPIGFSLDGGLLMSTARGSNGLSFYVTDIKSGSSHRLAQVPAHMMYSAVSAVGQYLALTDGKTISWGRIDWQNVQFVPIASSASDVMALTFSGSNLIGSHAGIIRVYSMQSGKIAEVGAAKPTLPSDAAPLALLQP